MRIFYCSLIISEIWSINITNLYCSILHQYCIFLVLMTQAAGTYAVNLAYLWLIILWKWHLKNGMLDWYNWHMGSSWILTSNLICCRTFKITRIGMWEIWLPKKIFNKNLGDVVLMYIYIYTYKIQKVFWHMVFISHFISLDRNMPYIGDFISVILSYLQYIIFFSSDFSFNLKSLQRRAVHFHFFHL